MAVSAAALWVVVVDYAQTLQLVAPRAEVQVYVGTASFDTGIRGGLTHRIAPDVDAARDLLTADLLRTGRV